MKAILNINQITCGGCAQHIRSRLEQEEAIHSAKVLPQFGKVRLHYDDKRISLAQIQEIMDGLGYPVTELIHA